MIKQAIAEFLFSKEIKKAAEGVHYWETRFWQNRYHDQVDQTIEWQKRCMDYIDESVELEARWENDVRQNHKDLNRAVSLVNDLVREIETLQFLRNGGN